MTFDTKSKCVECGKTLPWHTLNAHKKCWDVIFDRIERQIKQLRLTKQVR